MRIESRVFCNLTYDDDYNHFSAHVIGRLGRVWRGPSVHVFIYSFIYQFKLHVEDKDNDK